MVEHSFLMIEVLIEEVLVLGHLSLIMNEHDLHDIQQLTLQELLLIEDY